MKLCDLNQTGRSMIEMLGVLAIVGILSVGGISAFQKAMMKHRTNKMIEQYTLFIQDYLLLYQRDWKKLFTHTQQRVLLAPYMNALGLPSGWSWKGGQILHDSIGYTVIPFAVSSHRVGFDFFFRQAGEKTHINYELCYQFFLNVVKPFANSIYSAIMYQPGNSSKSWHGTNYCQNGNCLTEMEFQDVISLCHTCTEKGTDRCVIAVSF